MVYKKSRVARWFVVASLSFVAVFLILSDIHAPYTTSAQVQGEIVNVAPRVSGPIETVSVTNGMFVEVGSPLFTINSQGYQADFETATMSVLNAEQALSSLQFQLKAQQENVISNEAQLARARSHYERYKQLFARKEIGQDDFESTLEAFEVAKQNYVIALTQVEETQAKLGEDGIYAPLQVAIAQQKRAKLNLDWTQVYTDHSGVVTNLQLQKGEFASAGQTKLVVVSKKGHWLVANFNEKGLGRLRGETVSVVFDAIPGKVFKGQVASIDAAVALNNVTEGELADTSKSSRWIRKTQNIQVRISLNEWPEQLVAGSLATVMVYREDSLFWQYFSNITMYSTALFRYVY
ncbi:HlyD family secretion protein [Vibrio sp. 10N.261.51.F12]|uniref:HlyD family secretion protein n=1 Tax=Vibrio sp. 10N.261.51.F12 TaxID=3229679 RepID=UPI00354E2B42